MPERNASPQAALGGANYASSLTPQDIIERLVENPYYAQRVLSDKSMRWRGIGQPSSNLWKKRLRRRLAEEAQTEAPATGRLIGGHAADHRRPRTDGPRVAGGPTRWRPCASSPSASAPPRPHRRTEPEASRGAQRRADTADEIGAATRDQGLSRPTAAAPPPHRGAARERGSTRAS